MINNDVMRSIRYMLDLGDAKVIEVMQLADADFPMVKDDLPALLKKEGEPGFIACSDRVLAHLLDGLVIYYRGRDESLPPRPVETRISNNLVLKKLRVAFELKEDDMHAIMNSVDCPVSKPEMSALFRKVGHSNYRACGDQFLRNFLKGLTLRVRGE
jgi:uncharacterized protein YehS (DUF1456 family)